jgi:hypothetical protein
MSGLLALVVLPLLQGFFAFFCLMFLLHAAVRIAKVTFNHTLHTPQTKPAKDHMNNTWNRH